MRSISPGARWHEEPDEYTLADVTRVDFGGPYEAALALVAEDDARSSRSTSSAPGAEDVGNAAGRGSSVAVKEPRGAANVAADSPSSTAIMSPIFRHAVLAVLGLGLAAAGAFVLLRPGASRENGTTPVPPARSVPEEGGEETVAPPAAAERSAAETAEPVAAAEPGTRDPPAPERFLGIAGRAILVDGAPASGVRLQARRPENGAIAGQITTGDDGAFRFETLDEGTYRLHAVTNLGLAARGSWRSGTEDALVTLEGYRLPLLVLHPDGSPARFAFVQATLSNVDDPRKESKADLRPDEQGIVVLHSPDPAGVRVVATSYDGKSRASRDGLYVGPDTSERHVTLDLLPLEGTAALQVQVRCRECGVASPFTLRLKDGSTGHPLAYLHSEDFQPGGVIQGLPAGEMTVQFDRRFREPPAYYRESKAQEKKVTLEPGRTTEASFVVACSGRLALLVTRARGAQPEGEDADAEDGIVEDAIRATLTSAEGELTRLHSITPLESGGWRGSVAFDLGRRQVSENVIAPGVYRLGLSLDAEEAWQGNVEIEACRLTEVVVEL